MNQQKQSKADHQTDRLGAVRAFARQCNYETSHCEQVAHLAQCLLDGLAAAYSFSPQERFCLICGAILHDIGWKDGQQKHHKRSMQMILADTSMPLESQEREIIALIARYHRKALPKADHPVYGGLSTAAQHRIGLLAGIVRLADGLDRTHSEIIENMTVSIQSKQIRIVCISSGLALAEMDYGREKKDLLEQATGCTIVISGRKTHE